LPWYGNKDNNYFKKVYKRSTRKYNLRTRMLAFVTPRRGSLSYVKTGIYVPKD